MIKILTGLVTLFLLIIFSPVSYGQISVSSIGAGQMLTFNASAGLRLPNLENVDGSPFLDNEYRNGTIRVKSGFDTAGVMVKYNIYGNEIVFLQDGIELVLDSMDMVTYFKPENGTIVKVVLKTGDPKIDGLNGNTIYRVLVDGPKFQLLKHYSRKLEDVKTMGEYNRKEFANKEQLYIYSPTTGMKKIKDKKALVEALPEFAEQIEAIVGERQLKFKKDTDYAIILEELNKP